MLALASKSPKVSLRDLLVERIAVMVASFP
jgi:hypothetical protein